MAKYFKLALAMLPVAFIFGCGEYGKVEQGRVVKFDKDKGVVTVIRDTRGDPQNPDYSQLPPLVFTLPTKPEEMGPEPRPGNRMKLDTAKNQLVMYDPDANKIQAIAYTVVDQKLAVDPNDPLVFDKEQKKPKKFPVVDRDKKTVAIYSARQKILTVFSVPEQYMSWPDSAWDAGDDVRIYYKEQGKALRFMNVTRTDIFR
jgi:hypothetical protein